jgi:hypothetical protein
LSAALILQSNSMAALKCGLTIPEFNKVAKMPVYPGKTFDGVVNRGNR